MKIKEGIEQELKDYLDWCTKNGAKPSDYANLKKYLDLAQGAKKQEGCKDEGCKGRPAARKRKGVNEGISNLPLNIQDIIAEHFDYTGDFDFLDIVANVIDRLDDIDELGDDDINDEVYSSIDDSLIYYNDQWRIMMFYQLPGEANLDEAIDQLAEDCVEIVTKIKKSGEGK